jgi:hypothetical protein
MTSKAPAAREGMMQAIREGHALGKTARATPLVYG